MKLKHITLLSIVGAAVGCVAQAATTLETWTYAGGGLAPTTYGVGVYRPATLIADTTHNNGTIIAVTGMSSGGLGSAGTPTGYGGIYTFFGGGTYTLNASNVLNGVQSITFSMLAGGGNPTEIDYLSGNINLNFNAVNNSVVASSFSKGAPIVTSTPIGNMSLNEYTWTWNVSSLGASTGFSLAWNANTTANHHSFFTDISLSQTDVVPEPSAALLGSVTVLGLFLRRRR